MDRTQLLAFCNYAIGQKAIGGRDPGDEITAPYAPELTAFVVACLGERMPPFAHYLVPSNRGTHQHAEWAPKSKAFATLLREVADGIDPPDAMEAASQTLLAALRLALPHVPLLHDDHAVVLAAIAQAEGGE